jgi:hypothetical protein
MKGLINTFTSKNTPRKFTQYSMGNHYNLGGATGQPDAGPKMSGGQYSVLGGFCAGMGLNNIYLPAILRH